ncbi:type IV secretory system conjugative DNA transfer family protein [Acidipropionibacterium timonense]|uniref:type IV secretory system conjugative DNA transfer family protein n=1 Tax=Acidipropionibacterium timonense TaxID=2161818 RepID=UPI0010314B32|nr:TraG/TraD/VirD4 family protein [Acidipropionibacterium timonense]
MLARLWRDEPAAALALVGSITVLSVLAILDVGIHVGWAAAGGSGYPATNPFALLGQLASGQLRPPTAVWAITAGIALVVAAVGAGVWAATRGGRAATRRGDRAARLTGRRAETASINRAEVAAKASRLGVDPKTHPGLPIARAVADGRPLWASWEDVVVDIWGPRRSKTTARAIPLILASPGATVCTSNKPDILLPPLASPGSHTDVRLALAQSKPGSRTWVFDPQTIVGEPQHFWWDPLTFVTDATTAKTLAEVFVDATRQTSAGRQGFFESASTQLLADMLLAAAKWPAAMAARGKDPRRVPLTRIHQWLSDETDTEPVEILRDAGCTAVATHLDSVQGLVHETRSGVYGGAADVASFLLNETANAWVTPQPGLPEFIPEAFVISTDALFLFSQEGPGSAAPVMTALTVAVTEAAVRAARAAGGRLPVPMTVVLDEAANVCRWRRLPDMYSFYGSHGICVTTLLQNWAQGELAWGREGMRKLWSAANVKVYGGGVDDDTFLESLSRGIGDHWVTTYSSSSSRQGRSSSWNAEGSQRRIATVADLRNLPTGRVWVFASGATPVLAAPVPWWKGPHADTLTRKDRS